MSILKVSDAQFAYAVEELSTYVAIPSVSNPGSPYYNLETLVKAAKFAYDRLERFGVTSKMISIEGSAPFVFGERIIDSKKPTILLYAHYDVQPVEEKKWDSKPFVMEEHGGRLYGRGASDDKAGIIGIFTALRVFEDAGRPLPVNIKVLFEGEEEVGSAHMEKFITKYTSQLHADALVILDGMNKDVQTGTLTSSTRGLVNLKLKVDALVKPTHSGIGCLAPDPAQALAKLITSLAEPASILGFMEGRLKMSDEERKLLKKSSQTPESYARDQGVLQGCLLRGHDHDSIYERVVEEPSISIINMNCGQPNGGNSIQDSAQCTIGIRVTPGQDPDRIARAVIQHILYQSPLWYVKTQITQEEAGSWAWKAKLEGPFTKKYLAALGENFPKAEPMPLGGALPLIRQFESVFPTMETLVPAVEDADTSAHSHNESQHKGVFRNAIDSLISFLDKAGS